MQTPAQLVPAVHPTGDRGVFLVRSRSNRKKDWRVDIEARAGLCRCECPDFEKNRNYDCWHVQQVRKYVTCAAAQRMSSAAGASGGS
jgi:hypothetical protein